MKIRGLVGSQNGTNIHMSVPTSLQYLPTNLYTLVVVFIYFRRLVESPFICPYPPDTSRDLFVIHSQLFYSFFVKSASVIL